MPVHLHCDPHLSRQSDDYTFSMRPDSSRFFARSRRFGNEDDFHRAMSQTSSPLRLSQVENSPKSSFETFSTTRGRSQYDFSPSRNRKERMSGAARQALAFCGELDEDDAYYKARRGMMSQSPIDYDESDNVDQDTSLPREATRMSSYNQQRATRSLGRSRATAPPMERNRELNERPRKHDFNDDDTPNYEMFVSRRPTDDAEEEEAMRKMTSYIAKRKQFAVEDEDDVQKLRNQKYKYRTRGMNLQTADDDIEGNRQFSKAPMFDMKLRSHVIWEKMYVKFTCTIRGSPTPKVTWYHNMVAIETSMLQPGKMRISSQFGVHTLEIFQAQLENSGTYRVSAQNHKGEISSYATLLVRRYVGGKAGYYDGKSGYNIRKPTDYPDVENLDVPERKCSDLTSKQGHKTHLKIAPASVVYSGIGAEVGEGKYETVLEFQIPGTHHVQEAKRFSLQESTIEPIRLLNRQLGNSRANVSESFVDEQLKEETSSNDFAVDQSINKSLESEENGLSEGKSFILSSKEETRDPSNALSTSVNDLSSAVNADNADSETNAVKEMSHPNRLSNASQLASKGSDDE